MTARERTLLILRALGYLGPGSAVTVRVVLRWPPSATRCLDCRFAYCELETGALVCACRRFRCGVLEMWATDDVRLYADSAL